MRLLILLFLYISIPQFAISQTLIMKKTNGQHFKYTVSLKELNPINNSAYDSLSAYKNTAKLNNIKYEGDKCCLRYFLSDKVLTIRYCGITVSNEKGVLWSDKSVDCPTDCNIENRPVHCSHIQYKIVDFTKDNEWVLLINNNSPMFVSRCSVDEYNLFSGIKKVYTNATNPSYSFNYKYLLIQNFKKPTKYTVYDRLLHKKIDTFSNVKELFWVNEN